MPGIGGLEVDCPIKCNQGILPAEAPQELGNTKEVWRERSTAVQLWAFLELFIVLVQTGDPTMSWWKENRSLEKSSFKTPREATILWTITLWSRQGILASAAIKRRILCMQRLDALAHPRVQKAEGVIESGHFAPCTCTHSTSGSAIRRWKRRRMRGGETGLPIPRCNDGEMMVLLRQNTGIWVSFGLQQVGYCGLWCIQKKG